MSSKANTGTNPTALELLEAKRIAALPKDLQRHHPTALPADPAKLTHINTYGFLPEFYVDRPFSCRDCGREEIWKAADQKWYTRKPKPTWTPPRCAATTVAKRGRRRDHMPKPSPQEAQRLMQALERYGWVVRGDFIYSEHDYLFFPHPSGWHTDLADLKETLTRRLIGFQNPGPERPLEPRWREGLIRVHSQALDALSEATLP